jgi:3'-phosphoadenosine 5'-phosphosulfate (PAPS) 3'-phosphatase
VEEAGGKVTDFSGESLCFEPSAKLFTSGGILATRLTVDGHELVLQQLQ